MDAATPTSPPHPVVAAIPGRPSGRAGALLHSGVTLRGFYAMHVLGASVPLVAGVVLYGWRAGAAVGCVVLAALVAVVAWRAVGLRGRQVVPAQAVWSALLLGLMLPAHLASGEPVPGTHVGGPAWPVLAAGGFLVVVFLWLVGGAGTGRFHAALAAVLLLTALFAPQLVPHWVLARSHRAGGDVLNAPSPGLLAPNPEAWLERPAEPTFDAFWVDPASQWMTLYTRGALKPDRGRMPLHELLRDRMPPLEDLVVGGHPAPVGQGSLIAVIVGGLFLMYRGVIDYRVPIGVVVGMYAALLVMPVPTVITEAEPSFRWLIAREPDVRWETAVTFVNYQMSAGPAVFTAFFIATAPSLRPLARRARTVYGLLIGVAAAAGQLYLSVAVGPYVAVAAVGLIAPVLDRWFTPRTLV